MDGLQTTTTPLFQVRLSQTRHLRLDKKSFQQCVWICSATKNNKVIVVQRSLDEVRCFTRSNDSTGENSSHQGEVTGGNNIHRRRAGRTRSWMVRVHASEISCEVTSRRRAEQSRGETSPVWQAKLGPETRDHSTTLQISFARFTAK